MADFCRIESHVQSNRAMQLSLVIQKNTKLIVSLSVAAIIFVLVFRDTLMAIFSQWTGEESAGNSHGPLVVVCSIYLLVAKKEQLSKLRAAPRPVGFLLLGLLLLLLFLAELAEINMLQMLILPLLILVLIFTMLGEQYLRAVAIPIAIIFFGIPIWGPIVPLLQDITTWVTEFNLNVLGRPVYAVGNYLNVTGGVFLIEEGCSGLRFLLIATILSLINSDLNGHNVRQGALLLAIAVGLALLANWVRVIIIVVLGDMTNMQHSLVHDHVNFGWLIFLFVVLIPYLLISRIISRNTEAAVTKGAGHNVPASPGLRYFLTAMLMLLTVPLLRYGHGLMLTDVDEEIELPSSFAGWNSNGNFLENSSWKPDYKNASREIFKSYLGDSGVEVDLFLIHYSEQEQGSELINVENNIADENLWKVVPSTEGEHLIPEGHDITQVNEAEIINNASERKLVWYWYDIGGYITANQYYAKLLQLFTQLSGKNSANLMAISTACTADCKGQRPYLEQYLLDWQKLDR